MDEDILDCNIFFNDLDLEQRVWGGPVFMILDWYWQLFLVKWQIGAQFVNIYAYFQQIRLKITLESLLQHHHFGISLAVFVQSWHSTFFSFVGLHQQLKGGVEKISELKVTMGGLYDNFVSKEMGAERNMEDVPFGYPYVGESKECFRVEGWGKTDIVFIQFENTWVKTVVPLIRSPSLSEQWKSSIKGGPSSSSPSLL